MFFGTGTHVLRPSLISHKLWQGSVGSWSFSEQLTVLVSGKRKRFFKSMRDPFSPIHFFGWKLKKYAHVLVKNNSRKLSSLHLGCVLEFLVKCFTSRFSLKEISVYFMRWSAAGWYNGSFIISTSAGSSAVQTTRLGNEISQGNLKQMFAWVWWRKGWKSSRIFWYPVLCLRAYLARTVTWQPSPCYLNRSLPAWTLVGLIPMSGGDNPTILSQSSRVAPQPRPTLFSSCAQTPLTFLQVGSRYETKAHSTDLCGTAVRQSDSVLSWKALFTCRGSFFWCRSDSPGSFSGNPIVLPEGFFWTCPKSHAIWFHTGSMSLPSNCQRLKQKSCRKMVAGFAFTSPMCTTQDRLRNATNLHWI